MPEADACSLKTQIWPVIMAHSAPAKSGRGLCDTASMMANQGNQSQRFINLTEQIKMSGNSSSWSRFIFTFSSRKKKNLTEFCPWFHRQNHHGYDCLNEGQTVFESS